MNRKRGPHAVALKGQDTTAQGEALGTDRQYIREALKGRDSALCYVALSGLTAVSTRPVTQGFTLGYRMLAFQANGKRRRWVGKGDRSIFPRCRREDSAVTQKNGPVPFSGFTLLEIILALAILAGSLAALGEVMRLADQNAAMTRDETQAQIVASSIMDELVAGARGLLAVNRAAYDGQPDSQWLFSIAVDSTGYAELVAVRVLVEQQLDPRLQPARYELLRWLPNPDYVPAGAGGGR